MNSNTGNCTLACKNATCGDGFLQAGEACDDGNQNNIDSCLNDCTINPACGNGDVELESGEECDNGGANNNTAACTASCKNATCGDGFIQAGEECDEG